MKRLKQWELIVVLPALFCLSCKESNMKSVDGKSKDHKPSIAAACEAVLEDLKIPKNSVLGKRLVNRDLDADDEAGVYGVSGSLDMNLNRLTFRLFPGRVEEKQSHSPWLRGKFYFAETGELRAKVID